LGVFACFLFFSVHFLLLYSSQVRLEINKTIAKQLSSELYLSLPMLGQCNRTNPLVPLNFFKYFASRKASTLMLSFINPTMTASQLRLMMQPLLHSKLLTQKTRQKVGAPYLPFQMK